MKRPLLFAVVWCCVSVLWAALSPTANPVAEGFPNWQGVVEKNHLAGREITPSDLRHRIVVVIELEPNGSLRDQLANAGEFTLKYPITDALGVNWEDKTLNRDVIILISVQGKGKGLAKAVSDAFQVPAGADDTLRRNLSEARAPYTPVYANVKFDGSPDTTGKLPYAYVLGPFGKDVLYHGSFDAKGKSDIAAAITKVRAKMSDGGFNWTAYYGTLAEEDRPPALTKALAKGVTAKPSPLEPIAKSLLKAISLPDAAKAANAQIAFDAIEQARSDLLMRIRMEYRECPHCAYYDLQKLFCFWPNEKKRFADVVAAIKADPQAAKLAQFYCKVMEWRNPQFACKNKGELSKVISELKKIKAGLEKMKESEKVVVQNGALVLDMSIDELISTLPDKVAAK